MHIFIYIYKCIHTYIVMRFFFGGIGFKIGRSGVSVEGLGFAVWGQASRPTLLASAGRLKPRLLLNILHENMYPELLHMGIHMVSLNSKFSGSKDTQEFYHPCTQYATSESAGVGLLPRGSRYTTTGSFKGVHRDMLGYVNVALRVQVPK